MSKARRQRGASARHPTSCRKSQQGVPDSSMACDGRYRHGGCGPTIRREQPQRFPTLRFHLRPAGCRCLLSLRNCSTCEVKRSYSLLQCEINSIDHIVKPEVVFNAASPVAAKVFKKLRVLKKAHHLLCASFGILSLKDQGV